MAATVKAQMYVAVRKTMVMSGQTIMEGMTLKTLVLSRMMATQRAMHLRHMTSMMRTSARMTVMMTAMAPKTMTPAKSQRKSTHMKPMTTVPARPQTSISVIASSHARLNCAALVTYSANSCVYLAESSSCSAGWKVRLVFSLIGFWHVTAGGAEGAEGAEGATSAA